MSDTAKKVGSARAEKIVEWRGHSTGSFNIGIMPFYGFVAHMPVDCEPKSNLETERSLHSEGNTASSQAQEAVTPGEDERGQSANESHPARPSSKAARRSNRAGRIRRPVPVKLSRDVVEKMGRRHLLLRRTRQYMLNHAKDEKFLRHDFTQHSKESEKGRLPAYIHPAITPNIRNVLALKNGWERWQTKQQSGSPNTSDAEEGPETSVRNSGAQKERAFRPATRSSSPAQGSKVCEFPHPASNPVLRKILQSSPPPTPFAAATPASDNVATPPRTPQSRRSTPQPRPQPVAQHTATTTPQSRRSTPQSRRSTPQPRPQPVAQHTATTAPQPVVAQQFMRVNPVMVTMPPAQQQPIRAQMGAVPGMMVPLQGNRHGVMQPMMRPVAMATSLAATSPPVASHPPQHRQYPAASPSPSAPVEADAAATTASKPPRPSPAEWARDLILPPPSPPDPWQMATTLERQQQYQQHLATMANLARMQQAQGVAFPAAIRPNVYPPVQQMHQVVTPAQFRAPAGFIPAPATAYRPVQFAATMRQPPPPPPPPPVQQSTDYRRHSFSPLPSPEPEEDEESAGSEPGAPYSFAQQPATEHQHAPVQYRTTWQQSGRPRADGEDVTAHCQEFSIPRRRPAEATTYSQSGTTTAHRRRHTHSTSAKPAFASGGRQHAAAAAAAGSSQGRRSTDPRHRSAAAGSRDASRALRRRKEQLLQRLGWHAMQVLVRQSQEAQQINEERLEAAEAAEAAEADSEPPPLMSAAPRSRHERY